MKLGKKEKTAIASLLGIIGLILIIIPIFTKLYPFTYGLLTAIIIWLLTGILKHYWGVKK